MKIIVTGAAGFIGSHVVERFLQRGDTVLGIDNLSRPGNVLNLEFLLKTAEPGRFHFFHGDIRFFSDMARVFRDHPDSAAVIHEAGQVAVTTSVIDPRYDFECNALGTFNVLEAARLHTPSSVFVFASTNKVYGGLEHIGVREAGERYEYADAPDGISESEPVEFHSPYGCSKGSAEQYVRDYSRIYGLKSVVFRQSCIYGTRQYGMEDQGWVAWFTIASVLGQPITVYGDGKQIRDLLWVSDLIDLYERAIDHIDTASGKIYNAGGGVRNTLSLLELLHILEEQLGCKIPRTFGDWRPGDQRVFVADNRKAQEELGWQPKTSPAEGVPQLVDWIRASQASIQTILSRKGLEPISERLSERSP
jgi:CDP-paratose 2-epimerase